MDAGIRETMARESLRMRALRTRYFPNDIFAEYAWVLLLIAYLHHIGSTIDAGETVPPLDAQVMRHWRRYLEQQDLVRPGGEPAAPPALTANGLSRMEAYLDKLAEVAGALR